jgi:sorting nexin-25
MSLSRRDVLLASFAGFVAWGFVVHWFPILRFLGYAFVGGVLVTLFALGAITFTTAKKKRDLSRKTAIGNASVKFLSSTDWHAESSKFTATRAYKPDPLYPQSSMISTALDGLLGLALQDFISSWYTNITSDVTFANEVDRGIRTALAEIRNRVLKEDIVNIAVSRLVPIITAHLRDFDQAERLVRGRTLNRNVTESEELDLAIAAKYRDGKLHAAASLTYADTKPVQQDHLRKILVRVLPDVLPENIMRSRAVSVLIKEIVACAVLFPVMQILSDPDTWNQLIEAYGRTTLQDRKTVRKLRAALDQHASPNQKGRPLQDFPRLAPGDSERSFERFVRAIRRTNNLSEARRFRSQVASQLKRESMVEDQDQTYLRRLETGKRVLDQKVARLASKGGLLSSPLQLNEASISSSTRARDPTLVEIMHDSSGLSYFMEFMDRQNLMSLVQFWVVVDGFRNPLEDDFGDEAPAAGPVTWSDADRNDIAQISEAYMSKSELHVPPESQDVIKSFLRAGRKATPAQYRQARTAVLTAQSAVLEELQNRHLPKFKTSDLYYKFLASDEASSLAAPHSARPSISQPETTNPVAPQVRALSAVRSSSQPKSRDIRRTALSSSDMHSMRSAKSTDEDENARRSPDIDRQAPLFDDDYDTDPLANSTYSIGQESQNGDGQSRKQVIENMEAVLNEIVTADPKDDALDEPAELMTGSPTSSRKSVKTVETPRSSLDFPPIEPVVGEKAKPSLATLGLVNPSSRIGVFSDDDLFPDEKKFLEDEYADPETPAQEDVTDDEIHEAAPGDLGLTEAISLLSKDIEKLVSQESVVDTLTRKAELTNNVAELRILNKSKASLQREIRRKELQRQQYVVQESDNSLYGRASIRIKSVMVGREEDGHEFALYVIEVQRKAGEQMPAASWAVARRYSEFHELQQRLRMRYPSTRSLDFPRRRVVMKLQKEFLHRRRIALESYLRELLLRPDVCRSREFRSFLSQQAIGPHSDDSDESQTQDIVTRIYNSVTDGMDDFLGNIAVLDQLSAAGQNLISAATTELSMAQQGVDPANVSSVAEAEAELSAFEDRELEPFVKPICDIFLETFELNRGSNWLRGRAVVVVLHQLLGGTVERKVRDSVRTFTQEDSILKYIEMVKESMWPGGKFREAKPRTATERTKSRKEASVMLATLVPDLAANVVGRANAQAAARRIFAVMNNERLNMHLSFTILDEVISVLFGVDGRGR